MAILTPTAAPVPSASLRTIVQRHPLVAYFFIACVGFWLAILPLLLGRDGLGLFPYSFGDASILFAMLGTFTGPLLAAYMVTAATAGKAGVRALLRRYVQWRVGLPWYLVALFGCLLIWLAGYSVWLNGAPLVAFIAQPSLILSAYLVPFMSLLILAFGEETGWRGFALPRLQQQYGSLRAPLVLAAMHGLWHLPALLVPGFISASTISLPCIVGWIATVMAVTFLYTWIFNHTGGSLLIAILVHAGLNASSSLMAALVPTHPALSGWQAAIYNNGWNLANLIPFAVAAVLIIVFTRGSLGYRSDRALQPTAAPRAAEPPLPEI